MNMIISTKRVTAFIFTLTLLGSFCRGAVILPVDAAAWDKGGGATDGTGSGGLVSQTILVTSDFLNLNGEPENPAVWTSDQESWTGDFQGEDVDSLSGKPWIVYDLGASYADYDLDKAYIITNAETNRGFKDIEIYYASDLAANPVTTWASSNALTNGALNVVDYDFTAGGWTQYGGTSTLTDANDAFGTQPQPTTEIDISGIGSARYIGIRGLNSFNDDGTNPFGTGTGSNSRAGINQIAFTGIEIPEPSTAILAGLGLLGVTFRRRRK
ncbi:MAG: PEP-CTERM sorting domain-containing protein [Lentisphaeria bacterium]|nr:PEP-CTERM sorting domain-containing protein [Lentisphaeria bacterium]